MFIEDLIDKAPSKDDDEQQYCAGHCQHQEAPRLPTGSLLNDAAANVEDMAKPEGRSGVDNENHV